ncbi:MAG TPA: methylmalonyl-CoA epimerase [Thermoleophilaceae bacterium]|nr:methylmalonyl-CoA epimerase [Thermoleophilaceae bacterium]
MFGQIDHIGIAVDDLDESITLYRDRLGMREQHRETVAEQGVHAVLLEIGDAHVELISPIRPEGSVARFLERNGPGLHHTAYRTADIEAELERLLSAGLRLIDHEPRVGILGSRVAFIHPKSTAGVLIEIVEPKGH